MALETPKDERGHDAGKCRGNDHPGRHLESRRPQSVGRLPQGTGHGQHGVLTERGDHRDDHQAHDEARAQSVEDKHVRKDDLELRRHEGQGEIAVDDSRYAGEHLQDGLEDAPRLVGRVLRQEDRRREAYGYRYGGGEDGDEQCARHERQHAVRPRLENGRPPRARQEVPHRDLREEAPSLRHQAYYYADGREYGDEGAGEEDRLDDTAFESSNVPPPAPIGEAGTGPQALPYCRVHGLPLVVEKQPRWASAAIGGGGAAATRRRLSIYPGAEPRGRR